MLTYHSSSEILESLPAEDSEEGDGPIHVLIMVGLHTAHFASETPDGGSF